MQWGKIKTILIVLLAVVNCILAWNLIQHSSAEYHTQRENVADMVRILERNNIQCTADVIADGIAELTEGDLQQDAEGAAAFAARFLGEHAIKQETEEGVEFLLNQAKITITNNDYISGTSDTIKTVTMQQFEKTIKNMLPADAVYEMETEEDGGVFTAQVYRVIDGVRIQNKHLSFTGGVRENFMVYGDWVFGTFAAENKPNQQIPLVFGSLLALMEARDIAAVDAITPCYYCEEVENGIFRVRPACQIATDAGIFTMDCLSKEIVGTL